MFAQLGDCWICGLGRSDRLVENRRLGKESDDLFLRECENMRLFVTE